MREVALQRVLEPEVMDTEEDAREYDAMDHSEPNAAFVERLIELGAHGRMLDIGTGPGHIPLLICERIPDAYVVGVDLAEHMLARANRRRLASAHADRMEFLLADAKGLAFEDGSFDVVFSNTILHHIPEPRVFLAGARRVLRPGGALLIRDLFRPASLGQLAQLVATYAGSATPYQRKLFGDSLNAALTPDELRAAARAVGLEEAEITLDSDRHMSLQVLSRTERSPR
jgi:ubiquinone/menaquinone biosynthesis C-methylase UbiE